MKILVLLFALVACAMAHTKSEREYRMKFCSRLPFVERCAHDLCKTLNECQHDESGAHFLRATVTRKAAPTGIRHEDDDEKPFLKKATVTRSESGPAVEKRWGFSDLTDAITKPFKETFNKIEDIKNSITDWTDDAKCYIGCLERDGITKKVACAGICKYAPALNGMV